MKGEEVDSEEKEEREVKIASTSPIFSLTHSLQAFSLISLFFFLICLEATSIDCLAIESIVKIVQFDRRFRLEGCVN